MNTIQISTGLLLTLLAMLPPAKPKTVAQLRRLAAYRGIRSIHRDGRCLPVKYASRRELLSLLQQVEA